MSYYIVTIYHNNGYKCSCCRQDWTEEEEFGTLEEVIEFVADFEFQRKNYKELQRTSDEPYGIDPDRHSIGEIREIKDTFDLEAHVQEEAQKLIPALEKKHGVDEKTLKRKAAQKKYRKKRAREKRERKQLEELKAKYEGASNES